VAGSGLGDVSSFLDAYVQLETEGVTNFEGK
jgi:hypothetical protein